ncbi:hypothetical protein MBLNU457_4106t1 [Dothideomycetes sp. NU457]
MADGLNHARAMRVAELMTDFRNLQRHLASIRVTHVPEDHNLEGYVVLRQCMSEGQAILNQPFQSSSVHPRGDEEQEKTQLRQIIMDASLRRFKVQKIYMKANAAQRWVSARESILKGRQPQAHHGSALSQISQSLRTELASITDARVELTLRTNDARQGKWLVEDPSLAVIAQMLRPR